jgi:hypothetical protein
VASDTQGGEDEKIELRRVINDAYAFVLGRQATQTFGALTYEELADQQIERIEGTGTVLRPNELARVDRVEQDLKNLINQIRDIPPERFVLSNPDRDVNTTPDPEDDNQT